MLYAIPETKRLQDFRDINPTPSDRKGSRCFGHFVLMHTVFDKYGTEGFLLPAENPIGELYVITPTIPDVTSVPYKRRSPSAGQSRKRAVCRSP
jgi:hypothetical protein